MPRDAGHSLGGLTAAATTSYALLTRTGDRAAAIYILIRKLSEFNPQWHLQHIGE